MASIKERKSQDGKIRYQVQIRLKGYPSQTATFLRKTDAKKWGQQIETQIREGRYFKTQESKKRTLKELIERYSKVILPAKRSYKAQALQLRWWIKEIGDLFLCDATPAIIADKRDKLLCGIRH